MSKVMDTSELESYARSLERMAKTFPQKQKRFLQAEGTKLKNATKREARKVGKKTGNYQKSIKRGKVYSYQGMQAVRVYSAAPHAHLIENGHRMVTPSGREVGFVRGYHVFEVSGKNFERQFLADIDDLLDEVISE